MPDMPDAPLGNEVKRINGIYYCFGLPALGVLIISLVGYNHSKNLATISELATNTDMYAICFGVIMGMSAVLLPFGLYLLYWELQPGKGDDAPSDAYRWLLALFMLGIAVGCGGLAIMTVRDNMKFHAIFASLAFGSQWLSATMLAFMSVPNHEKCSFSFLWFVMSASGGAFAVLAESDDLRPKPYWFEFAFILLLTLFALRLAGVQQRKAKRGTPTPKTGAEKQESVVFHFAF